MCINGTLRKVHEGVTEAQAFVGYRTFGYRIGTRGEGILSSLVMSTLYDDFKKEYHSDRAVEPKFSPDSGFHARKTANQIKNQYPGCWLFGVVSLYGTVAEYSNGFLASKMRIRYIIVVQRTDRALPSKYLVSWMYECLKNQANRVSSWGWTPTRISLVEESGIVKELERVAGLLPRRGPHNRGKRAVRVRKGNRWTVKYV